MIVLYLLYFLMEMLHLNQKYFGSPLKYFSAFNKACLITSTFPDLSLAKILRSFNNQIET